MVRRLLTSTFGVAIAAVLAFGSGLAVATGLHHWRLSPLRFGLITVGVLLVALGLAMAPARRLARPVRNLAPVADPIRSGDARPGGRPYGIAELHRVAPRLHNAAPAGTDFISA